MQKLGSGYVLHEPIGRGAFGQVWRGSTVDGDRPVAVKVLRGELADDPEAVARFVQERSVLLGFSDPHLVTVRDLVVEGDTLAIVMDLVNGVDLRVYLRERGTLAVATAVALTCQVLRALSTVHAAGVVHRDLKPANVLVDITDPDDPQARLTDFGIARLAHGPSLTRLTGMIGTPMYMAPELAHREHARPPADVYSAGIMLYELLAGQPPFSAPHPVALLRAHMEDAPQPIPGLPPALWDVIAGMLAKAPAWRPTADAAERALAGLAASGFQPVVAPAVSRPGGAVPGGAVRGAFVAGGTAVPGAAPPADHPWNTPPPAAPDVSQAPTAVAHVRSLDGTASAYSAQAGASVSPQPGGRLSGPWPTGALGRPARPGGHRRLPAAVLAAVAAVALLTVGTGVLLWAVGDDSEATVSARPATTSHSATTTQAAGSTTAPPTQSLALAATSAPPPEAPSIAQAAAGTGSDGTGSDGIGPADAAGPQGQAPAAGRPGADAPPPAAPAPKSYDMPVGFPGSWSGTVSQPGSTPYTVKIALTDGDIGENVGRASYPDLGCIADLYLTDVAGSTIRVQGRLVVNSYNACVAATLDLSLRSGSSMNYLAQSPGLVSASSAVLYR
ncbi:MULTISPECIES: serine/threonine-protein kinase [Protofrankia]|uniref:non-specific serine/threonine protein kinase n=1 Tax=Candidatus Protofrankia datiscae TaxID=2716812 RepID=F8AVB6_9ACTN|nr:MULTISPECIES: serine/threonine-protein kinase [Protofrankia]AEH08208.1 serine/threonine protein kinase [Candidatus Protofrankia datiscae]